MAETDAEKVVRSYREFFNDKGRHLKPHQMERILRGDAEYQRTHGREDVAQAVEKLAAELGQ